MLPSYPLLVPVRFLDCYWTDMELLSAQDLRICPDFQVCIKSQCPPGVHMHLFSTVFFTLSLPLSSTWYLGVHDSDTAK